jgi:hypothetical protein
VPLPVPAPDQSLLRISLLVPGGKPWLTTAGAAQGLKLTLEPGDDSPDFYQRWKLAGGPTKFVGRDFHFLYSIEASSARCQRIGLLVEHRAFVGAPWAKWLGTFTCNDCKDWNPKACSVSVLPVTDDGYRLLLDNYDQEKNILLTPGTRQVVTAKLATLAAGVSIEFQRVNQSEQADYIGTDGWSLFLQNTSWIKGAVDGQREVNNIIFRYRLRGVDMIPNGIGGYTPIDKSNGGWTVLNETFDVSTGKVDYVKTPGIAGFKTYKIGTYNDWLDPRNAARYNKYGDQLLVVGGFETPSTYGYDDDAYVEVTGPDDYGANNAECRNSDDGPGVMLSLRRETGFAADNCARVFWRFGDFRFGQCFRFIDGFYSLLSQTVLPFGGKALLPPMPEQLSTFLTALTNPATGDTGEANEMPRLLLSAGSDVKRYGASEPATRLLISLKQFLADSCVLWDAGWFIDPATGWLRFEDRSYVEAQASAGAIIDMQSFEEIILSQAYSYRTALLPRYEDLVISNASTEDLQYGAYFSKSSIDYGLSACVNTQAGASRTSLNVARLTGDVAAGVLSGDALPDSALFVLAPDEAGRLSNANRELAANRLLLRYYRRGRSAFNATIEPPAPQVAPNSVTGVLPPSGPMLRVLTVKPPREQAGISGKLADASILAASNRFTTNLGAEGQLAKAELTLANRAFTATVNLPPLVASLPPFLPTGSVDPSFDPSFDSLGA